MNEYVKTMLQKSNTPIIIETLGHGRFQVTGRTLRSNGYMRFSNEWIIKVIMSDNNVKFLDGFEIAASEIDYSDDNGRNLFEARHPGVLREIHDTIKNDKGERK